MSLGPDAHSNIFSDAIAAYLRSTKHRGQLKLVSALELLSGGKRRWNVRTKCGFRIAVDLNDMVQKAIMDEGVWDTEVADALSSRWTADDTFFDIGANIGFFSLQALQQGLRVVAFEPMPLLADLVEANVKANQFERMTLVRSALSSKSGKAAYRPGPSDNSGAGHLVKDGSPSDIPVPITTVDDFIAGNGLCPTIVKIDVEGHELDVLNGASRLLKEKPPHTIVFEADVADTSVSDLLRRVGYSVRSINSAPLDGKSNFLATMR